MWRTCMAAMLIVASAPASAGWEAVGTSPTGYLFADRDSIHKEGDKARMVDLIDYKERQPQDGISYQSARIEVEYDCKEKRFRNLSATLYPYRMGEGDALRTYDKPEDWQPIPAGSGSELLAKIACDNAKAVKAEGKKKKK